MTPGEREKRAAEARAALNDPAVTKVLEGLERDAVEVWSATDLSETEKREITYFQLLGIKQIRQQLINWSRDTKKDG